VTRNANTHGANEPARRTGALPVEESIAANLPGDAIPVNGAPIRQASGRQREIGGREGPEPTRYGDWELRGRCIDF
jgi:hypothetical protein